MAFDDTKESNGRKYTGMSIGSGHRWIYPNGIWEETKVAPDQWRIRFNSVKRRSSPAPERSGVPLNTSYLWHISADQVVVKTSKDEYLTALEGLKTKIAHKRPYWKRFSCCYEGQQTYRQKLIATLRSELAALEAEEEGFGQDKGERALSLLLAATPLKTLDHTSGGGIAWVH